MLYSVSCLLASWENPARMAINPKIFASKVTWSDYRYTSLGHSLLFYTLSTGKGKPGFNHPERIPPDWRRGYTVGQSRPQWKMCISLANMLPAVPLPFWTYLKKYTLERHVPVCFSRWQLLELRLRIHQVPIRRPKSENVLLPSERRLSKKKWYYSLACAVFPWVWYSPLHRRLILSMGGRWGWRVYIQVTLCTTEGFGALSLWGSAGRTHLFWWQTRLKAFLVTTGFLFLFPFKATQGTSASRRRKTTSLISGFDVRLT